MAGFVQKRVWGWWGAVRQSTGKRSVVARVRRLHPPGIMLGRRMERNPHLHACPGPARRLEHRVTAVSSGDRLHDGQAEAAAVTVVAVVPAPVEPVERAGR